MERGSFAEHPLFFDFTGNSHDDPDAWARERSEELLQRRRGRWLYDEAVGGDFNADLAGHHEEKAERRTAENFNATVDAVPGLATAISKGKLNLVRIEGTEAAPDYRAELTDLLQRTAEFKLGRESEVEVAHPISSGTRFQLKEADGHSRLSIAFKQPSIEETEGVRVYTKKAVVYDPGERAFKFQSYVREENMRASTDEPLMQNDVVLKPGEAVDALTLASLTMAIAESSIIKQED